jgi:CDP-diacylglycerol--glycerol-3-phosphate 3-phosphatidyltransferase
MLNILYKFLFKNNISANNITGVRLFFIPIIAAFCFIIKNPYSWWPSLLTGMLAMGDLIDGAYARATKTVTIFGAFFDVITDRIYIMYFYTVLVMKNYFYPGYQYIIFIFIFNEILTTSFRLFIGIDRIKALRLGRAKFVMHVVTIVTFFAPPSFKETCFLQNLPLINNINIRYLAHIFLMMTVILSYLAMYGYMKQCISFLRNPHYKKEFWDA